MWAQVPTRAPKMLHWSCFAAFVWEYLSVEQIGQMMKIDLPPRLGLGTICIAPLYEVLVLPEHVFRV